MQEDVETQWGERESYGLVARSGHGRLAIIWA
jgi:hypothetical protein